MSAKIIYPGEFQKPVEVEFKTKNKDVVVYDLLKENRKAELAVVLFDLVIEYTQHVETQDDAIEIIDAYTDRILDVFKE